MISLINGIAEVWFRYMASATLQATLLALFILGILWIGRNWSPALRYALLILALCKFLIPPMLSMPTGLFNRVQLQQWSEMAPPLGLITPIVQNILSPVENVQSGGMQALPAPSLPNPTITTKGGMLLLHLSGALLLLALAVRKKLYLRKLSSRATTVQDPALSETYNALCRNMKLSRRPQLLISKDNHAPITFGVWKPVVMLPQVFVSSLSLSEIRVILGHELAHHRRLDPWLAWLQVVISAIWWFNPVYWLLSRRIRSVREDCCDDMVLASGLTLREVYCRTLLNAARLTCKNHSAGAALAYLGESQPLRRRFKRIMNAEFIGTPKLAMTGMLLVTTLGLVLLPGVEPHIFAEGAAPDDELVETPMLIAQQVVAPTIPQQPTPHQKNTPTNYYQKWLDEDVIYIITPEEKNEFLALKTDEEREFFIEQFWLRRNPTQRMGDNPFREEHYRRIAYANRHYNTSGIPGWKTDRGRIYIMFGPPDQIESHPMSRQTIFPFEKWWYRHLDGFEGDVEIEFVDQSRTGEYRVAVSWEEFFSNRE